MISGFVNLISSVFNIEIKEHDCKQGNERKLDCKSIKEFRERINNGESIAKIADERKVARSTIARAVKGTTYKDCL